MHDFTKYAYSLADIKKAVHGIGMPRRYKFKYAVYSNAGVYLGNLANVSDAEISIDNTAKIKKSIRLTYKKGDLTIFGNKLVPYISFMMPDGNYLDFPQGQYVVGDMGYKEAGNSMFVDATLFDEVKLMENDRPSYRYFIPSGANYTVEIRKLIQKFSPLFSADFSTEVLAVEREWDVGTSYLQIINDLLKDINYADIWTDERGVFRAKVRKTLDETASEYTYDDGTTSIQCNGVADSNDYFSVPNKWIVTATNPDQNSITSILTNDADIASRGQTLTRFEPIDYIANQTALNEYVRLMADNDRVTDTINFETALAPFHDIDDIYTVVNTTLGINAKYKAKSWSMPLELGAKMRHVAERKV